MMKVCYYAVARGQRTGVFKTWAECEQHVKHYPNACYKKFSTYNEALSFIESNGNKGATLDKVQKRTVCGNSDRQITIPSSSTASNNGLSNDAVKRNSEARSEYKTSDGITIVYTDGACLNNGQYGAKAGIGVFWGVGHPDNVSEPIIGRATNNRAEYFAIISAIERALQRDLKQLIIRTDSNLLIKSMTLWLNKWKRNGWKTNSGTPVENQDLLQRIDQLMQQCRVNFEKVQGHSNNYGNDEADFLAKRGAEKAYSA